jgi:integrase
MFGLMVGAGLRVGEMATLHLDNVEEPTEPGHLAKLRVRGKGNKDRLVWLSESLWDILPAWLKVRPMVEMDRIGLNLISIVRRVWTWLATYHPVEGWESFWRADLEAWLEARSGDGISEVTIRGSGICWRRD